MLQNILFVKDWLSENALAAYSFLILQSFQFRSLYFFTFPEQMTLFYVSQSYKFRKGHGSGSVILSEVCL